MPYSLTQGGITVATGMTSSRISGVEEAQGKRTCRERILTLTERGVKRNVYYLKPLGIEKAHEIEDFLNRENISIETLFVDDSIRKVSLKDPELSAVIKEIETVGEMYRDLTEENGRYNRYSALTHVTNALKHIVLSIEVFQ